MKEFRKRITLRELNERLAVAANVVKLICGVANNAAALIMLEANDQLKKHSCYRHSSKMFFRQSLRKHREMERDLLHARFNRFFHLAAMSEDTRKFYGHISDSDYFELWQGIGARAYDETRPLITSLWNKYRLSLIQHHIQHADIIAWAMTGMAALELACKMYTDAVHDMALRYNIPVETMEHLFVSFNLRPVAELWRKGLDAIEPTAMSYDLDEVEDRNIDLGLIQLEDAWSNPAFVFDCGAMSVEDFSELFRTKGEWKKAIRLMKEAKQKAQNAEL